MKSRFHRTRCIHHRQRAGAALLMALFIISIVTVLVVNVLDTTTLELSALRNTMEYEGALYLANAGVHEAAAKLETDSGWRGTITDGPFPDDDSYSCTVVDGPATTVIVTSQGVAGNTTRTVQAVIEL